MRTIKVEAMWDGYMIDWVIDVPNLDRAVKIAREWATQHDSDVDIVITIEAEADREEIDTTEYVPTEQSPSYRAAMIDAGRGHLLP